ncbi:S1/P1 nuclease [Oceaniserpentilla sp. 4NH20-0058]|uniref:S1/P1 nuclease n=1 Tax=Oceaniserpentilla sp. 4NH20-0058 TaxID=3127660 RepID=UPI0031070F3B
MKSLLFILCVSVSQWAFSFSDYGHKLVALAAWEQLTPDAKHNVERILGAGKVPFVQASVWADHIKSRSEFDYLKPLHYVNMPKDAVSYERERDCKKDACIVEAIKRFTQKVKSGTDSEKVVALKMLVHLFGDIHQPLHAGLYEDRGGNWYKIKYNKKSMSLHKFWDNQVVKRFDKDLESATHRLLETPLDIDLLSPQRWAKESHELVMTFVYQAQENQPLSKEYLAQADSTIQMQLAKGAWRLAMWLNRLW